MVIVFFFFYFKPYFKQETTINPIKNKGGAEVDAVTLESLKHILSP
jgi:hypothetical protein